MLSPFWGEYARVQSLVEIGKARDEQLDSMLKDQPKDSEHFDLHNSRRWLKNFSRNLERKVRTRKNLLKLNFDCVGPKPSDSPEDAAIHLEQATLVRRAAGKDWPILRDTLDGDYLAIAHARGIPTGTLKSYVSRARAKLRTILEVSNFSL